MMMIIISKKINEINNIINIIQIEHEIYMNIVKISNILNKEYIDINFLNNLLNDNQIIYNNIIKLEKENEKFYESHFFNNFTTKCKEYTYLQIECIIDDNITNITRHMESINLYEYILYLFIYYFDNIIKFMKNYSTNNYKEKIKELIGHILYYKNKLIEIKNKNFENIIDNEIINNYKDNYNNFTNLLNYTEKNNIDGYINNILTNGGKKRTKRRNNKLNNKYKKNLNISY